MTVSVPVVVIGTPGPLVGRTGASSVCSALDEIADDGAGVDDVGVELVKGDEDVVSALTVVLAVVVVVLTTVDVGISGAADDDETGLLLSDDDDVDDGAASADSVVVTVGVTTTRGVNSGPGAPDQDDQHSRRPAWVALGHPVTHIPRRRRRIPEYSTLRQYPGHIR